MRNACCITKATHTRTHTHHTHTHTSHTHAHTPHIHTHTTHTHTHTPHIHTHHTYTHHTYIHTHIHTPHIHTHTYTHTHSPYGCKNAPKCYVIRSSHVLSRISQQPSYRLLTTLLALCYKIRWHTCFCHAHVYKFLTFKVLLQPRKELHFNFSVSGQGCMWDVPGFFGCEIISEGNLFSDSE